MKSIALLLFAVSASAQTVPSAYQGLYQALGETMTAYDASIPKGQTYPTSWCPQLDTASSSKYLSLLDPIQHNLIITQLNALQAMGATGITVHIDFPILYQPFWDYQGLHSTSQKMYDFYAWIATLAAKRSLNYVIETQVAGPSTGFTDNPFASYLGSLSWPAYMMGRAANALSAGKSGMGANMISVVLEPDSEATKSGQPNAGTVSGSSQLVNNIVAYLRGYGYSSPIAAGAGTWLNNFADFEQAYAAVPGISALDFHVYPIMNGYLSNMDTARAIATSANIGLISSEAWLHKESLLEIQENFDATAVYGRDPFSFWSAEDVQFLQMMSDWANANQLGSISPSYPAYLVTYLPYGQSYSLPPATVLQDEFKEAARGYSQGTIDSTGLTFESISK